MKMNVRLEAVGFNETIRLFQAFSERFEKLTEGWKIFVEVERKKATLIYQVDVEQESPVVVSRKLFSQMVGTLNEFSRTQGYPFRFCLLSGFLVIVKEGQFTVRVNLRCTRTDDET